METMQRTVGAFLLLLVAVLILSGTQADEKPDFDALASRLAAAIRESTKGAPQGATVLILDFREKSTPASELGRELATEFDAALRKRSQGFVVLDAADLKEAIQITICPRTHFRLLRSCATRQISGLPCPSKVGWRSAPQMSRSNCWLAKLALES